MEQRPTKAEIRRILGAMKRSKKKYLTLEALSRLVGLYPDVLGAKLLCFHPMILIDPSINTRDLVPEMEAFLAEKAPKKETKAKKKVVKATSVPKKELDSYSSIGDFVRKKMTNVAGLVDSSMVLTDMDLAVLKKLIEKEENKRKKAKR